MARKSKSGEKSRSAKVSQGGEILSALGDLAGCAEKIALPEAYNAPKKPKEPRKSFSSTRKALHRDRQISIRTTYRIEIDGKAVTLPVMVMPDGTVRCHGLPNYSFTSAVDLARKLIDLDMDEAVMTAARRRVEKSRCR